MAANSAPDKLLIYGATGYTGRLTAGRARAKGLTPVLAGRDAGRVQALAAELGFEGRAFALTDTRALHDALRDMACVLHMAGPFSRTSAPMLEACLEMGVHYVDITGEIQVFEQCAKADSRAKACGIMVLPGAGFDVVPSDCLAKHTAGRIDGAMGLSLAIAARGNASRGTAKTAMESVGARPCVRRGGRLAHLTAPVYRDFDYGSGPRRSVTVSWGDVSTAYYSTGIPDIDVYFPSSKMLEWSYGLGPLQKRFWQSPIGQWLIAYGIDKRAAGPSDEERAAANSVLIAEVVDGRRNKVVSKLTTPNGYELTAETALEVARRVLAGDFKVGFQTPSNAYGADFILGFDGVTRLDLTPS